MIRDDNISLIIYAVGGLDLVVGDVLLMMMISA